MKKLFAIILSFGLILSPVQVARAQGDGFAKQILGMCNGFVGGMILTKCRLGSMHPSLILFMSGSLVYLVAEITTGKKKTQDVNQLAGSLDQTKAGMKEGGDYQVAALEAQVKNEESNVEFIEKRRKWFLAIKVIYIAATAAAIVEAILMGPPYFKPGYAACLPGPQHGMLVQALIAAYSSAQQSGSLELGQMAMGMVQQVAMKKLFGILPPAAVATDTATTPFLNTPEMRAGVFGALTALVFIIDGGLKKDLDEAKRRRDDAKKALAEYKKATQSDNGLADNSSETKEREKMKDDPNDPSNRKYALKGLAQGQKASRSCFTSKQGGIDYSESGCANPLRVPRSTFDSRMNIPTLNEVGTVSADMAQAVSDGDMGKADLMAGKLESMAARVTAVRDDLVKKMNEQLKKEGKKPLDFEAPLQRQIAAFNDAVKKNGAPEMAIGGGATAPALASAAPAKEETAPTPVAAVPDLTLPADSITDVSAGDMPAEETPPVTDQQVASLSDSLEGFETNVNDISKDTSVSIFKQLSNRYILNYTRIFKKVDAPTPEAVATPETKK